MGRVDGEAGVVGNKRFSSLAGIVRLERYGVGAETANS